MARLFVLDALGLAYRAYYAFIRRPLVNSRGENTSAIFGLANTALKIRREEQPEYWALAWDGPGPTFRHERYADYKATRKPMPADLLAQIPAVELIREFGSIDALYARLADVKREAVRSRLAAHREQAYLSRELVTVKTDLDLPWAIGDLRCGPIRRDALLAFAEHHEIARLKR